MKRTAGKMCTPAAVYLQNKLKKFFLKRKDGTPERSEKGRGAFSIC
jgi:hypothetical protein